MTATDGKSIPFQPRDQDVIATRRPQWCMKHSGALAYFKLIDDHVELLPPAKASNYDACLVETASRIVEIITVTRQGRFLRLSHLDETRCTVMSHKDSVEKVKVRLDRIKRRILSPTKNGSSSPKKTVALSMKETQKAKGEPPLEQPQMQQIVEIEESIQTTGDLYSYPTYVHNKRKASRDIHSFFEGLCFGTKGCCGNSWCVLWRPHYVFSNPHTKKNLVSTVVAFHAKEHWARTSLLSLWFVKKNKYRIVFRQNGSTIHICKNSLCRVLGLTEAEQESMDRDQRILAFMKRHSQQAEKSGKQMQTDEIYQEYVTTLQGSNVPELIVSPSYFRCFWEITFPNVQASLWVNQNSKRSIMDDILAIECEELKPRASKRLRKATPSEAEEPKPVVEEKKQKERGKGTEKAKPKLTEQKGAQGSSKRAAPEQAKTATLPAKRPRVGNEARVDADEPKRPAVVHDIKNMSAGKAARRVSADCIEEEVKSAMFQTSWRCGSSFRENTMQLKARSPQRPSIASLNRKHLVQKRKARFIRRGAFHTVSKLSRL